MKFNYKEKNYVLFQSFIFQKKKLEFNLEPEIGMKKLADLSIFYLDENISQGYSKRNPILPILSNTKVTPYLLTYNIQE